MFFLASRRNPLSHHNADRPLFGIPAQEALGCLLGMAVFRTRSGGGVMGLCLVARISHLQGIVTLSALISIW